MGRVALAVEGGPDRRAESAQACWLRTTLGLVSIDRAEDMASCPAPCPLPPALELKIDELFDGS